MCVQLGATLANHNKSEQAVQVYAKALNIRPTYARGWLNLGEDGICVTIDLEVSSQLRSNGNKAVIYITEL